MWRKYLLVAMLWIGLTTNVVAQGTYVGYGVPWRYVTTEYEYPLAQFNQWWNEVQSCSWYTAPSDWKWYKVNMLAFTVVDEGDKAFFTAYTLDRLHSIFIITRYITNERRIKHEMLHAILAYNHINYSHQYPMTQALFDICQLNNYEQDGE